MYRDVDSRKVSRSRNGPQPDRLRAGSGFRPVASEPTPPSAGALMRLQRTMGNRAVVAMLEQPSVQRGIVRRDQWDKFNSSKFTSKLDEGTAKKLEYLKSSVTAYLEALKTGNEIEQYRILTRLKMSLALGNDMKKFGFAERRRLTNLQGSVDRRLKRLEKKQDVVRGYNSQEQEKKRQDEEFKTRYRKFGGDAGEYATRDGSPEGMFANLANRDETGELSDEGLEAMESQYEETWTRDLKEMTSVTGLEDESLLETAIAQFEGGTSTSKDQFTGKSSEAEQLRVGLGKKGEMVSESRDLAGFKVTVWRDNTDLRFEARVGALEAALELVGAHLTERPSFQAWLPKYGFRITPGSKPGEVEVHKGLSRAEFFFPDFLLLTPGVMDSSVGNSVSSRKYAEQNEMGTYDKSQGIASCVHELGHLMHYKLNRRAFVDVNRALLKGEVKTLAKEKVSEYGSTNPKEFVAEIFASRVYGGKFDEEVMKVYRAFGGPVFKGDVVTDDK